MADSVRAAEQEAGHPSDGTAAPGVDGNGTLRAGVRSGAGAIAASGLPSSERVYQGLKDQILAGSLAPNSRLVELQLASQFQVSRTPVREALKRLAAEGLVSVDPLRGMVVREVDPVEIEEIYVIREVLDGLASRLAAQRITDADLTKLHLLMEMMRESVRAQHWEAMVQANIKFHEIIHSAAGNQRLSVLARSLQDFVRRFSTKAFASTSRDVEVLLEHEEIVKALESRDPDLAEVASRRHVTGARSYLSELYLSHPTSHGGG